MYLVIAFSDSIEEKGKPIFDFLLNYHFSRTETCNIHYFIFQENFSRAKNSLQNKNRIILHDCITNACHWKDGETKSFMNILNKLGSQDVVFIDSLAHVIYQYGLAETYRIFNTVALHSCKFILSEIVYI